VESDAAQLDRVEQPAVGVLAVPWVKSEQVVQSGGRRGRELNEGK